MATNTPLRQPHPVDHASAQRRRQTLAEFFRGYFWFIVKNVIGWILILSAFPLGVVVPGPGGIPIFLIGFALVTFPGKRKLTSRVMRGRPIDLEAEIFTFATAVVSVLVTLGLLWLISDKYKELLQQYNLQGAQLIGICLLALVVTWLVARLALQVLNWALQTMPKIRRQIRPWLRKRGIKILPPRRKRAGSDSSDVGAAVASISDDEILLIDERHHNRIRWLWSVSKPWLNRAVAVGITVAIFVWILGPIFERWPSVRGQIYRTSIARFALASGMFALFLFAFRALVWRLILLAFRHKLPVPAATRIWITSELARYVPGVIWQVVGRVFLSRPYGVASSASSLAQALELAIFLLANVLVALVCVLFFGIRHNEGAARVWLILCSAVLLALAVLLHPNFFYRIIERVMQRLGRPITVQRLRGLELSALLGWNVLGLLWQSLAVFLLLQNLLDLSIGWWWVIGGAYCLAWIAGFVAVWAPAGIGVREVVFLVALFALLPDTVRLRFGDGEAFRGFLAYLTVLVRLWTVAGELLLATIAYALDMRGALGYPDAPGRDGSSKLRSSLDVERPIANRIP